VSVLGVATAGKDVMASSGQLMCFRSFTDESGVFETVFFPQAYARLLPILEGNNAFLLLGVPKDDMGALAVHVYDMVALNRAPQYRG
jgi:DNA polymerase III alpha subunit